MATDVYAILFLGFYGLLMILFVYTSSATTRGHKEVVKGRKEDEEED